MDLLDGQSRALGGACEVDQKFGAIQGRADAVRRPRVGRGGAAVLRPHRAPELGADEGPQTAVGDLPFGASEQGPHAERCRVARLDGQIAGRSGDSGIDHPYLGGSMRILRSPATPMVGVRAMPLSTQKTPYDGDTPIPERWKSPSLRSGTYLARVTPARSVSEPAISSMPAARRSAIRSSIDGVAPPFDG